MADTHNCSSDAFCNNTHGSFNCTCKPGFTGDGENCTGSIFSGTSLCSLMTAETLSYFFHSLPLLQLACHNNAMTELDLGEAGGLGG